MSTFHERLRLLRVESGKTQAEIAEALMISAQTLSYYFNGREPSYDLLIKLAQYFNVSTDYLLGLSDNMNNEEVVATNKNYSDLFDFLEKSSPIKNELFHIIEKIRSNEFAIYEQIKLERNFAVVLHEYKKLITNIADLKERVNQSYQFNMQHFDSIANKDKKDFSKNVLNVLLAENLNSISNVIGEITGILGDE